MTGLAKQFTQVKLAMPVGRIMVPQEPIPVDEAEFTPHLTFDWFSMGGSFSLGEVKASSRISFAATESCDDGVTLVALIEPGDSADVCAAYYRQVFLTNGAAFKFGLFGSLPVEITNNRPGLLPDDLVRDAMWDAFRVAASEDEEAFQQSVSDVIERMPPLDQECALELLDDIRAYPHRQDDVGHDGTSRLELRWLFERYWRQVYGST